MKRIRRAAIQVSGHLLGALRPEPGTTEGAVMAGLAMLGAGFALVWPPLGLIVPGTIVVAIGLGFTLQRRAD